MKEIALTRGKIALVDDNDYQRLSEWKWCAVPGRYKWYAYRTITTESGKYTLYMHRYIIAAPSGISVDHIDGDGLNNTRANLRLATHSENTRNRPAPKSNTSGYKGVSWEKRRGNWSARIELFGKPKYLGTFSTPEDAARAYDLAALELFGEYALTNFPVPQGGR